MVDLAFTHSVFDLAQVSSLAVSECIVHNGLAAVYQAEAGVDRRYRTTIAFMAWGKTASGALGLLGLCHCEFSLYGRHCETGWVPLVISWLSLLCIVEGRHLSVDSCWFGGRGTLQSHGPSRPTC